MSIRARRPPAPEGAGAGEDGAQLGAQPGAQSGAERVTSIRLPDPVLRAAQEVVAHRGTQLSAYIRDALIEALIYDGGLPADFIRPHVKRGRPRTRARQSQHGPNQTEAE